MLKKITRIEKNIHNKPHSLLRHILLGNDKNEGGI